MRKKHIGYGLLAAVMAMGLLGLMGCSRVQKFNVTEADDTVPYQNLGTLEVETAVPRTTVPAILWTSAEVMTATLIDSPERGDHYKALLRSKLGDKARRYYGADAVINVVYWPEPNAKGFPHGKLYARGEMIRYEKFPTA